VVIAMLSLDRLRDDRFGAWLADTTTDDRRVLADEVRERLTPP
jgi:hypothetical protein